MRVCILSTCTQKHMILVSTYQKYFQEHNIEYDFIYPDKYHEEEKSTARKTYRYEVSTSNNPIVKVFDYFRFIKYAKKTINSENYDLIIAWNEVTASLFSNFLVKSCSGKYIVVVLDLFNEKSKLKNEKVLTAKLNRAIEGSLLTTVSSPGYIQYLSKNKDYLFVDNINNAILPPERTRSINKNSPICILYSGHISYPELAMKMILRFKGDDRFKIKIIGSGSDNLANYVKRNQIKNIEVRGKFASKDTVQILDEGDIIYNVYDNKYHCERTALSNKLYYATCMNVPILVSPDTYMERITHELGIGFTIDFDDSRDICDELYNWFMSFDPNESREKCCLFKKRAFNSHNVLYKKLDEIFGNIKKSE